MCECVCVCACCAHFWCFTPDADASTSSDYSPPSNRPHQPSPPLIRTRTHTHTLTHQHYNAPETPAIRKSTWVRRLSVCVCFTLFRFRGTFWCAGSLKSSPPPPLPSSSLLRTTHAACRHLAEPPPRCRVGRLNKHQITHMAGAGRRRRSQ